MNCWSYSQLLLRTPLTNCAVSEILNAQQLEGVYNSLQPNKDKWVFVFSVCLSNHAQMCVQDIIGGKWDTRIHKKNTSVTAVCWVWADRSSGIICTSHNRGRLEDYFIVNVRQLKYILTDIPASYTYIRPDWANSEVDGSESTSSHPTSECVSTRPQLPLVIG